MSWRMQWQAMLLYLVAWVMSISQSMSLIPMAMATVGVVGLLADGSAVSLAVSAARRTREVVRHVPPGVPWALLAILGALLQYGGAAELQVGVTHGSEALGPSLAIGGFSGGVARTGAPLVVGCSMPTATLRGEGSVSAHPGFAHGAGDGRQLASQGVWASGYTLGTWVVDSGAELMIAGAFMYQYGTIVSVRPNVYVYVALTTRKHRWTASCG